MKRKPYILLCCALATFMAVAAAPVEVSEEGAVKAAESWLALVDAGEYGRSWDESAELFRSQLTREKWEQSLTAVRKPLGNVVSRKVKETHYATSLPGVPDGEYVIIQFATTFTNKKSAVETVTPMKDPDGVWRVSGYYIG